MSKETSEWLNTMTLIGFTEKRGNAWHYREEMQGDEPNHYVGPVPVEDVERRLFNFKVVERRVAIELPVGEVQPDGTRAMEWVVQSDDKAMCTDDDNTKLGQFKKGYQGHDYSEWLLGNVANLLDGDLSIGSAGLLRNRGVAWVSIEVPENVKTPEGVEYRPNLVGTTSFDGSRITTYKRMVTNVVCDNTLTYGLSEQGQVYKVKHTKNSAVRIGEAREALAMLHTMEDDFAAEVKRLCEMELAPKQWEKVKDILVPVPTDEGAGRTIAITKRYRLDELWNWDSRVAPWSGTAWGALQAFNTWRHHDSRVKGGINRGVRNMDDALSGKGGVADTEVVKACELVLSN